MIQLEQVEGFPVSAIPVSPARSSMGDLDRRSSLVIKVTDRDGATGWGEIWSNFPPSAAAHRLAILQDLVFPSVAGRRFDGPPALTAWLEARWRILARHTGETGPFENIIAGLDIAAWDLCARRAGLSLAGHVRAVMTDADLPDTTAETVAVYASSPNRDGLGDRIAALMDAGHRAVKLKVGYDAVSDEEVVALCREVGGPDLNIMVDANQSWSLADAREMIPRLDAHRLTFVEEPVDVGLPDADLAGLAKAVRPPLAFGENVRGMAALEQGLTAGYLGVLQPSVTKIGGVTGWMALAHRARVAGIGLCPHYMGAAPGLAVTMQLLSLFPDAGPMELDANDNPLRTALSDMDLSVRNGRVRVPDGPGIGFEPDAARLRAMVA
ncbi:mandelate racemase/muconate lactonizing enzyme family protein [Oceanomicrobium pacificus]|uniref:Mandelate racemase/muconate lactonizing enzyme family protein n=1 Tax=Oceanomicrobium pacificus TaxID=2692916 RepID=A0A6B0TXK6_9RHOB|nr:mandelate racemase/muconate lactonizing enzyme family protein [Oceanomicrobium pacificus]MXU66022.1 mandelate racemase/muconate lactonizing enzyme family protein [Oceanomicrobium pacificus]